jgi:hypothetical protein
MTDEPADAQDVPETAASSEVTADPAPDEPPVVTTAAFGMTEVEVAKVRHVTPHGGYAHGVHASADDSSSDPEKRLFSSLDRSFGSAIAAGYAAGMIVLAILVIVLMRWAAPDIPFGAAVAAGLAAAFFSGVMGSVFAVGYWSFHHDHELFYGGQLQNDPPAKHD